MDDQRLLEQLEGLATNLEKLASVAEAQLSQSTLITSALRGKLNGMLSSGMVQLNGAAGNWRYDADFTVDYASIGFIDSLELGPYTISADAMGSQNGPGTFLTGATLAAVVPLIGKHLSITSASWGAAPPQLFVAVFAEIQPLNAQ